MMNSQPFGPILILMVSEPEILTIPYNLCNPFKHDHRCASLSGVEFVFTKERREKEGAAEVIFERVTDIISDVSTILLTSLATRTDMLDESNDFDSRRGGRPPTRRKVHYSECVVCNVNQTVFRSMRIFSKF